jgi:hypothetical protein
MIRGPFLQRKATNSEATFCVKRTWRPSYCRGRSNKTNDDLMTNLHALVEFKPRGYLCGNVQSKAVSLAVSRFLEARAVLDSPFVRSVAIALRLYGGCRTIRARTAFSSTSRQHASQSASLLRNCGKLRGITVHSTLAPPGVFIPGPRRSADVKLNERVSLRDHAIAIA